MRLTYLLIDLLSLSVPLIASFHPRLRFHREWAALMPALVLAGVLLLAWDAMFTRLGVWGFNSQYLLGIYVAGLPLEEVLFFFCIPYACLFSYHSLLVLDARFGYGPKAVRALSIFICAICLAGAVFYANHYYTVVTLSLLFVFIGWHGLIRRNSWMGAFLGCYTVMMLPFCIVNGILTGTGLDAPVVWYNPAHMIDARIGTIPVEDVAFGMLMIGMQTSLFEYFKKRMVGKKSLNISLFRAEHHEIS